jgi:hypothetical protein
MTTTSHNLDLDAFPLARFQLLEGTGTHSPA